MSLISDSVCEGGQLIFAPNVGSSEAKAVVPIHKVGVARTDSEVRARGRGRRRRLVRGQHTSQSLRVDLAILKNEIVLIGRSLWRAAKRAAR